MKNYNVIIEISDVQLANLHNWSSGKIDSNHPISHEIARQVALGIPEPFKPAVGDWVFYDSRPAKIIGRTSGLEYKWVLESFESEKSNKFEVITANPEEVSPYSVTMT